MLKKFVLGGMVVVAALLGNACGDDGSSESPAGPADSEVTLSSSSDDVVSSSSEKDEAISSSSDKDEKSSSSKKVESSSSTEASSSSTKIQNSSSSVNVKESSSSSKVESSSGKDDVSSSSQNVQSSSSDKPVESSSSMAKSSSSEISSSSVKPAESSSSESSSSVKLVESSSSEESSSSLNPVESSSSEMSSSSSSALNSIYDAENNTLTDLRDGQVYKTVTIGLQVWMAENLNYLPKDTAGTFWAGRSVCGGGEYKSLQEGDCSIYGRLYESDFTTNEKKKQAICPDGWELPTKRLYETMISYLGENPIEKIVLKDIVLWPDIEEATNESGFSALPSGYYNRFFGYNEMESEGIQVASFAIARSNGTAQNQIGIVSGLGRIWYSTFQDGYYMAIRCIKD